MTTEIENSFKPAFTPAQMLELGSFGGFYFGDTIPDEFPKSWKAHAKISKKNDRDTSLNVFRVNSGLTLEQWQKAGWIHDQDPLGWFQWYCRYYMGRRTADDARQIKRHIAYTRHLNQVVNMGNQNLDLRKAQRQSLLHWAYDPVPDFPTLPGETAFEKLQRVINTKDSRNSTVNQFLRG